MDVIIRQRCTHLRVLNVPEAAPARDYQVRKWSNKVCERCLWKQIAPETPFPSMSADIDITPTDEQIATLPLIDVWARMQVAVMDSGFVKP